MNTFKSIAIVCTLGFLAGVSWADRITLKDGSVRDGTIVSQTGDEIRIKVDNGGLTATITVAARDVAKIERGTIKQAAPSPAPPAVTTRPAAPRSAGPAPVPAPASAPAPATRPSSIAPTRGFLYELGESALGNGPGSVTRLPKDLQDLWADAIKTDAAGKKAATLESLRKLEEGFRNAGALERLDGLSIKEKNQPFGLWLASVHYDVISENYHTGIFDLTDVRDVERQPLIGILKEKTGPAIEPLKTYFPPVNEKTGKQEAFKATQLSGITVDNCLDTKDKAELAHALLLGQTTLEPHMPQADRIVLNTELTNVNHIVTRCRELEPRAKKK